MTIRPPIGVRLASKGDEGRIYNLFVMAHAENGFGDMYEPEVRAVIQKACDHDRQFVIAVIDGPERIEAALGLRIDKMWYNSPDKPENWFWTDLLFFVHPLHRRSRHAARLKQFARFWEKEMGNPVVLNLLPREDLEKKEKFFGRHATRIGSSYVLRSDQCAA